MDVVPCDCVVSAAGRGASDGENEPLIEGSPQQAQDPPALWGVWEVGCPGRSFIRLTWAGMLLLQTHKVSLLYPTCLDSMWIWLSGSCSFRA